MSFRHLYRDLFPKTADLLRALGIADEPFRECDFVLAALWERIRSDDDFIRRHRFESLRESLTLDYPSYILALAMGAGKTALIGAIIATEFALAQEYPEGPFVKNALVFAPGKTIIESLRELAELPYDRILPPRFYKPFAASVKLTFTRDGEKDIPVIRWPPAPAMSATCSSSASARRPPPMPGSRSGTGCASGARSRTGSRSSSAFRARPAFSNPGSTTGARWWTAS